MDNDISWLDRPTLLGTERHNFAPLGDISWLIWRHLIPSSLICARASLCNGRCVMGDSASLASVICFTRTRVIVEAGAEEAFLVGQAELAIRQAGRADRRRERARRVPRRREGAMCVALDASLSERRLNGRARLLPSMREARKTTPRKRHRPRASYHTCAGFCSSIWRAASTSADRFCTRTAFAPES